MCAQRDVIQTYIGHAKAVKDLCFSNDGARFVSAGFDRFMREWDTETGAVLGTYTTGKQPHVVKIHPDDGKQSIFLVGMGDKKIVQWDTRSGVITQVRPFRFVFLKRGVLEAWATSSSVSHGMGGHWLARGGGGGMGGHSSPPKEGGGSGKGAGQSQEVSLKPLMMAHPLRREAAWKIKFPP